MAPLAKGGILLINLTPDRPTLNGLDLSTIRSHNAYRNQHKREQTKSQRKNLSGKPPQKADPKKQEDLLFESLKASVLSNISPQVSSDSLRSDPFDSLPVPSTGSIHLAVDHYAMVIAPLYGQYLSDGRSISNGCLEVILPQAIQHPYFFHVLIAISRTICLAGMGRTASDDSDVMFHRGQALLGLKDALTNPSDDVLPLAVLHMVSLDWRLGLSHAMQEHAKGLQRLLNMNPRARSSQTLTVLGMLVAAATSSGILQDNISQPAENADSPSPPSIQHVEDTNHRTHPDQIPSWITWPDSSLPPSLQSIRTYSTVSTETISVLKLSNETFQHELHDSQTPAPYSRVPSDDVLMALELRVHRQALFKKDDILGSWLLWGVIALIFQCYSAETRRHVGHDVFDRLNKLIKRPSKKTHIAKTKTDAFDFDSDRSRSRRDCAIWVLMCLAGASAKRRTDDRVTTTILEGPVDRASSTLIRKVRILLHPNGTCDDSASDWNAVESVVTRFWCPSWLLREWEVMWKEDLETRVKAAAYYRVYHHWHSAILLEDVFI